MCKNPAEIAKAYTEDSVWRNRSAFLKGHEQIVDFLTAKWQKEKSYRLRKELVRLPRNGTPLLHYPEWMVGWLIRFRILALLLLQFAFTDDKIAVQFWYEYRDAHDGMKWKRCYGLEDWTFAADGRMRKRQMSGNDVELGDGPGERWFAGDVDVNTVEIGEEHW
ncbi:hypothetical protein SLS55_003951 [Diplodia seriata]|uniref:DUF1348-domain-containing protein n=1 Tax=Diplodia seriata TaxID=420778 RepID=A0ABR3CJ76_9PEZI